MPITTQRNLIFINVKDYGATGNGVTDDTAAITAAITVANGAGGGIVFFPAGTYITGTQLLYSKVHLWGAGTESTLVKLKTGTNADLLQGSVAGYAGPVIANIAAANATGVSGGIDAWSFQNITFDGNKANQSGTSWIARFYGLNYRIHNVVFRNGLSGGVYTDWNAGGTVGNNDNDMAAMWTNFKIHDCNGVGLEIAGPHDSQFTNGFVYKTTSHPIHIGPNASAIVMEQVHPWGATHSNNSAAVLIEGGYSQWSNCVFEGSDVVQVAILAGDASFSCCHIFGTPGDYTVSGIQIGQQATTALKTGAVASPIVLTSPPTTVAMSAFLQFVITSAAAGGAISITGTGGNGGALSETLNPTGNGTYQSVNAYQTAPTITYTGLASASITVNGIGVPWNDSVNQSAGVTTAVQVGGYTFTGKISHCEGSAGAVCYVNDGGGLIVAKTFNQAGKNYTGTPSASSSWWLPTQGQTADGTDQTSGTMQVSGQTPDAFTVVDGLGHKILQVDTFNKNVILNASTGFQWNNSGNTAADTTLSRTAAGLVKSNGAFAGSGTSQGAIANAATITTFGSTALDWVRVAPTGNVTGIIMQAGVSGGQECTIFNESAFTVTMDVSGTSHVADGASDAIPTLAARKFKWDSGTSLWYPCK